MTAVAEARRVVVDGPGVYDDLPAADYHADPVPERSLSYSGAKRLLPPSCPALFKHWRDNGQQPKQAFDFGHAAHRLVLGVGEPLAVVDAADWRTKYARQQAEKARALGQVPILAEEYATVVAMAEAIRRHPVAAALLDPTKGKPEQSLFWRDERTGVMRRCRLDFLRDPINGRLILPDYKTSRTAEPVGAAKAMVDYCYHQQADWYLSGAVACGLAGDQEPAFVLIYQEKTPPYLVTVAQPDTGALAAGRDRNRKAIDVFRRCMERGEWPGWTDADGRCTTDEVITLAMPRWAAYEHQAALERGDYDIEDDR